MKKGKILAIVLPGVMLAASVFGIWRYQEYEKEIIAEIRVEAEQLENQKTETQKKLTLAKTEADTMSEKLGEIESMVALYQECEESADAEKYLKEKMLSCYLENEELILASKTEVFGAVGVDTSYLISYTGTDVKGEIIDELEGAVVGELLQGTGVVGSLAEATIDSTIDSLVEDFSMQSLYDGVKNGIAMGVKDVAESTIQDQISNVIGFDVFGAADLFQKISGCKKQIPEYLASRITDQMDTCAICLEVYVEQDNLMKMDIDTARCQLQELGSLADELYQQTDGEIDVRIFDWEQRVQTLGAIYNQYSVNEQIIALCEERLGGTNEEEN